MKENSLAEETCSPERLEPVFRVRVSLERYFSDERARCYMAVAGARPVRSLARRLRRTFRLPRPFALLSRGHLLPPAEPLALLRPDDPVEVVPTKSADYLTSEMKNIDECEQTSSAGDNNTSQACFLNGIAADQDSRDAELMTAAEELTTADDLVVQSSQDLGGWDEADGNSVLRVQGADSVQTPSDAHDEQELEAVKRRALQLLDEVAPRRRRARRRRRTRPRLPSEGPDDAAFTQITDPLGETKSNMESSAATVVKATLASEPSSAPSCGPAAAVTSVPLLGVLRNGGAAERGARLVRPLPADKDLVRLLPADKDLVRPLPADKVLVRPLLENKDFVRPLPADKNLVRPLLADKDFLCPLPADKGQTPVLFGK